MRFNDSVIDQLAQGKDPGFSRLQIMQTLAIDLRDERKKNRDMQTTILCNEALVASLQQEILDVRAAWELHLSGEVI